MAEPLLGMVYSYETVTSIKTVSSIQITFKLKGPVQLRFKPSSESKAVSVIKFT